MTVPTVELLHVDSHDGVDSINVSGVGGLTVLHVDGGAPASPVAAGDRLNVTASLVIVNFGTDPSSGLLATSGGALGFSAIESINLAGDAAGSLTINGTNGNDAINQNGNSVTVNNGAVVNFASGANAYPTLTLDGKNGDDDCNIRPATLTGVTAFNILGGDPTASDELVVNGTVAADTVNITPTAADGGTVAITGARQLPSPRSKAWYTTAWAATTC